MRVTCEGSSPRCKSFFPFSTFFFFSCIFSVCDLSSFQCYFFRQLSPFRHHLHELPDFAAQIIISCSLLFTFFFPFFGVFRLFPLCNAFFFSSSLIYKLCFPIFIGRSKCIKQNLLFYLFFFLCPPVFSASSSLSFYHWQIP